MLEQQKRDAELAKLYGNKGEIAWGNQIRSYVMQPYQMVKDHRTNFQTSNVTAVLDGDYLLPLTGMTDKERAYLYRVMKNYGPEVFLKPPNILATTYHGIKGMEADTVILNPNLTKLPAASLWLTPEEERRVAYVGMTRAKERLLVRPSEGGTSYPFAREIPGAQGQTMRGASYVPGDEDLFDI